MRSRRSGVLRGIITITFVLAAGLSGTAGVGALLPIGAHAAAPNNGTFMCFTPDQTFHQIFGPQSFFLNENQQGPTSFQEDSAATTTAAPTVTLPLYSGIANGHKVYYVITDASSLAVATQLGVNFTPKLANSANTSAVQMSRSSDARKIVVPGDVDFSPVRALVPSSTGFPPTSAAPGAVGNTGYSPLVQLRNGVVINAPQIGDGANLNGSDKSHWADKVASVDTSANTVTYFETNGCYENQSVHYISTDASDPGAAAIEDVTYAPNLNNVPSADCGTNDINVTEPPPFINKGCARESLIAFINGQTGTNNTQRQGLNSAILDNLSPLNILEDVPNAGGQFNYSPMWDIHLMQWNSGVQPTRQGAFADAAALVGSQAQSIGPNGPTNTLTATGFVVDCPLMSIFANAAPMPAPPPAPTTVAVPSVFTTPGVPGTSASFTVIFPSMAPGQGQVYFGSGPGCFGLVEVATRDVEAGTTHHTVVVTGNDLPGTAGDNGIQPGATYWFEVVTATSSGPEIDNNSGACYSVTIPTS